MAFCIIPCATIACTGGMALKFLFLVFRKVACNYPWANFAPIFSKWPFTKVEKDSGTKGEGL